MQGTLEQRRAWERDVYERYQHALVDCMAGAGFAYAPPPFVDIYAGWDSMPLPTQFASLVEVADPMPPESPLAVGARLTNQLDLEAEFGAHHNPGYTDLDAAGQADYSRAQLSCQPADEAVFGEFDEMVPQDLLVAFEALLDRGDRDADVQALLSDYPSCLAAEGVQVEPGSSELGVVRSVGDSLFLDLHARATTAADPRSLVAEATGIEARLAAADTACRSKANRRSLELIGAELPAFLDRWTPALARVASAREAALQG